MDTQIDQWAVPTEYPPAPADLGRVKFRDGEGGDMPRLWAEYMLNRWWAARDSKLTFASAVKDATVHFMVGEGLLCTPRSCTGAANGPAQPTT